VEIFIKRELGEQKQDAQRFVSMERILFRRDMTPEVCPLIGRNFGGQW